MKEIIKKGACILFASLITWMPSASISYAAGAPCDVHMAYACACEYADRSLTLGELLELDGKRAEDVAQFALDRDCSIEALYQEVVEVVKAYSLHFTSYPTIQEQKGLDRPVQNALARCYGSQRMYVVVDENEAKSEEEYIQSIRYHSAVLAAFERYSQ